MISHENARYTQHHDLQENSQNVNNRPPVNFMHTFSITCTLSVWVSVSVGVHTGGVTNITVLGTCTVSRRTWVELQVGARDTGSEHCPVTILCVCGGGGGGPCVSCV